MAVVFELYNADGSLQMSMASRLTKFLGAVEIQLGVSGVIVDPALSQGTPWFCCLSVNENYRDGSMLPSVTFSENTMTWDRHFYGTADRPATIIYGVYSNGVN